MRVRSLSTPSVALVFLAGFLAAPSAFAGGPAPVPRLWSAVTALDALTAARTCSAEPGCTWFEAPDGLVTDPATGQPLLSVHVKGAMDIGPLLDWIAAAGVQAEPRLVEVFGETAHEVDLSLDLLDLTAWEGLVGALDLLSLDAFVSLHGIPARSPGLDSELASIDGELLACAGAPACVSALGAPRPWLDAESGVAALLVEVAHSGAPGEHDAIAAGLGSLGWSEPPPVFAVTPTGGGDPLVRVFGRMPTAQLGALGAWLDGRTSWTRPLNEDELSMVRLHLSVAEAAAELAACAGDGACHHQVSGLHGVVASPAGRLGIIFAGEDPDIDGLNGLEYPGWSLAPPGYMVDGATGLLSFDSLRDLGLGRWDLGEALSVKPDDNPELVGLALDAWLASWDEHDQPLSWSAPGDDDDSAWADDDDSAWTDDDDSAWTGDDDSAGPGDPPPPGPSAVVPRFWATVSTMDVLAAARVCLEDPECSDLPPPAGIETAPGTGQALMSVHVKGPGGLGALADWASGQASVAMNEKAVHAGDKTGLEVDLELDLLDPGAWAGLAAALETMSSEAYVSIHAVPVQQPGVDPALVATAAAFSACAGDADCLKALRDADRWLDIGSGTLALQVEVPHEGGSEVHDQVVAELAALGWVGPLSTFDVEQLGTGAHLARVVGLLPVGALGMLQGWMDGHPARSRPLTEDEMSSARLKYRVVDAMADLVPCGTNVECLGQARQSHQAVVSPAGLLGIVLAGEDPDIEGLNGLEYPGWTMAPESYWTEGIAGLVSWQSLRALGLGRWNLGDPVVIDVDDNPALIGLPLDDSGDAWTPFGIPTDWGEPGWGDDDDLWNPEEEPDCEPLPQVRTAHQAVTWILPHQEDPATCPAQYQAAFLGLRPPTSGYSGGPLPPSPSGGGAHLVQPSMPSRTFFLDYLHCRELMAHDPASITMWSPEYEYCAELDMGLGDLVLSSFPQALYPDLYELAYGVPINAPPGQNNGAYNGGAPRDIPLVWYEPASGWSDIDVPIGPEGVDPPVEVPDSVIHTGYLATPQPAVLPEVKLHAFEDWTASVAASVMLDERTLTVTGNVHVEEFSLPLTYVMSEPEETAFTESVDVPAWSWQFSVAWSLPDWEVVPLSMSVQPGDFDDGFDLHGQVAVSAAGEAAGLHEVYLASHAEGVVEELVRETIEDRLLLTGPALRLFFFDYLFETNGLLAASASNTGEWVQELDSCDAPVNAWVPSGERTLLALDRVEGDETWTEFTTTPFGFPNNTCRNQRSSLGFAAILQAEVPLGTSSPDPVLWPESPPGFRELVLDDGTAMDLWYDLGMDTVAVSTVALSGAESSGPSQRQAPMHAGAVSAFIEELMSGYVDWAFTDSQSAFDCETPAADVFAVCSGLTEVPDPPRADTCTDPATDDDCTCLATVAEFCACREQLFIDECRAGMEPEWVIDGVDTDIPDFPYWMLLPIAPAVNVYFCASIQAVSIGSVTVQSGPDHLVGLLEGQQAVCPSQQGYNPYDLEPPPEPVVPHFDVDDDDGEVTVVLPHCAVATVHATANVNLAAFSFAVPPGVPSSCPGGIAGYCGDFPEDRSAMRPTESPGTGPLWEGQDIVYAVDTALEFEIDVGLEMEFRVPFRFQDVEVGDEELVGWDSMVDWFWPMMEQVETSELESVLSDPGGIGIARTEVVLSVDVANPRAVGGTGTLYLGPASFSKACPSDAATDDGPWDLQKNVEVPMPQCFLEDSSGDLDPVVDAVREALGGLEIGVTLPNIAQSAIVGAGLLVDPNSSVAGLDPGMAVGAAAGFYAGMPLPAPVILAFAEDAIHNDGAYLGLSPDLNRAVGAYQHLFTGLGIENMGWPTREAVWLAMLDPECGTLSDPSAGVGACGADVLVELSGAGASETAAPALWLFPPSPAVLSPLDPDPLWSGATWKPGRLPPPP